MPLSTGLHQLKTVTDVESAPAFDSIEDMKAGGAINAGDNYAISLFLDYDANATGTPGYGVALWYWNHKLGTPAKWHEDVLSRWVSADEGPVIYTIPLVADWVYVQVYDIDTDGAANGSLEIGYTLLRSRVL